MATHISLKKQQWLAILFMVLLYLNYYQIPYPDLGFIHLISLGAIVLVALFSFFTGGIGLQLNMTKPVRWSHAVWIGASIGILMNLLARLLLYGMVEKLTHQPRNVASIENAIRYQPGFALQMLVMIWTLVILSEEWVFRGFIMKQLGSLGGNTEKGWLVALVVSSMLFGLAHMHQGVSGMINSAILGSVFGWVFLRYRNMWYNLIAHGVFDTCSLALVYFNWDRFFHSLI